MHCKKLFELLESNFNQKVNDKLDVAVELFSFIQILNIVKAVKQYVNISQVSVGLLKMPLLMSYKVRQIKTNTKVSENKWI